MPTFEEMQRESSERLVSFAKHAKLSVRSALLDTDGPIDVYSEKSYRELANVMVTDFIPLGVHKLQGNGINLLAKDVRENAEKVSSILDSSIHEEKGIVDKRREAMVIVNDVMSIDGLTQWHINGVAEKLSALQDDRRVTRSTFTPERARMLIEATDGFLMSVQNRVVGMSTLYADDRVDNVAAFHDTASIEKEMTRLDKERFRGASDTQRKLWQHDVEESDMGSSDSSHFWSRSGSESLDHWSPGHSDLDSNQPSSDPSSPRSINSRSEHGSASSGRSSSDPRSGYGSGDTYHRFSSDGDSSDGILDPFPNDRPRYGQATLPRTFQAGRRLGASQSSRESSSAPHETPHNSSDSRSWSGISTTPSNASRRSNRSERGQEIGSPRESSVSTDEETYVVNRWPGASQVDGLRAFRSGDRHAAAVNEQARQDLAAGRASSGNAIPETRENSPVAGPSDPLPPASQQGRKRGRADERSTSEETSTSDEPSNKRRQLISRSESASRGRD